MMLPPYLPQDTSQTLGPSPLDRCQNRSLALERFANPKNDKENRSEFFRKALAICTVDAKAKLSSWNAFIRSLIGIENILFEQLQDRLMVNMAGGVMENAGICLDRISGIPFIPGSAVKGCARRAAIQMLQDAELGAKPGLLTDIALVFGWGDQEWKDGRNSKGEGEFYSDFCWACGADWAEVRHEVAHRLAEELKVHLRNEATPWKDLPAFAGRTRFLPAFPWATLPADLERDVLTCHHSKYYGGNNDHPIARDDEDPIPVEFPAVAKNHIFAFAFVVDGPNPDLNLSARSWLKTGLEIHGIGAKTAAGYGWFTDATTEMLGKIEDTDRQEREGLLRKAEEEHKKQTEEAAREERIRREEAMQAMSPEQREDYAISQLNADQFRTKLEKIAARPEPERLPLVRALFTEQHADAWIFVKAQVEKKKKPWMAVENEIRRLAKQAKLKLP